MDLKKQANSINIFLERQCRDYYFYVISMMSTVFSKAGYFDAMDISHHAISRLLKSCYTYVSMGAAGL